MIHDTDVTLHDSDVTLHVNINCNIFRWGLVIPVHHLGLAFFVNGDKLYPSMGMLQYDLWIHKYVDFVGELLKHF